MSSQTIEQAIVDSQTTPDGPATQAIADSLAEPVNGNLPDRDVPTIPVVFAGLSETVARNLMADDPTAMVQRVTIDATSTRRPALSFLLSVGQEEGYLPNGAVEALGTVPNGRETEYDKALRFAAAVRGGTVQHVEFGWTVNALGLRVPVDPKKVQRELLYAFARLPFADRKRCDIGHLPVQPNSLNAENINTVAGYVLVKFQGYRVK